MVFKKVRYNAGQEIFNVKILDPNGGTLEKWVLMKCDFADWADIIMKKYGATRSKHPSGDRDLDWAM